MKITIEKVKKQPKNTHWSYPLSELSYLLEQVEDGDREDGEEFWLYNDRLYEKRETPVM